MQEITAIEKYKNSKCRCNIFLEGKNFCSLKKEFVDKYNLSVGTNLFEEELINIQYDCEKDFAYSMALNLINRYQKTVSQVKKYLKEKGFTYKVIDYVVDKFCYYKYLDDAEFCKRYIDKNKNKKGKKRIEFELKRLGIVEMTINEAIAEFTDDNELLACKNFFEKYFIKKELTFENKQKAIKHLLTKGFTYSTIKASINMIEKRDYSKE